MKPDQFGAKQGYGGNKLFQEELKQARADLKRLNKEIENKRKAESNDNKTTSDTPQSQSKASNGGYNL